MLAEEHHGCLRCGLHSGLTAHEAAVAPPARQHVELEAAAHAGAQRLHTGEQDVPEVAVRGQLSAVAHARHRACDISCKQDHAVIGASLAGRSSGMRDC